MSAEQAAARAKTSGKPVVADALTTEFEQTTANPDGTYTLTESATPSRVYRDGAWKPLDASLHANADGTISPAATSSALTLSTGGSGPLATLVTGGQSFALTLPVPLPKPALSGNTATYAQVIPGVDLIVTVTATGAFSDVFEVHDAKAAADPRLASLLSAKIGLSSGLTQSADENGNISVTGRAGHSVFTAAAPYAWDSATSSAAGTAKRGTDLSSQPASSVNGPGRTAHITRLGVKSGNGHLTLSAPASVTSSTATYPVYIDPTYSPSYGANAWASFGDDPSVAKTQELNKSTDPTGDAFIGLGLNVGNVWSAFNFALPDTGTSSANNLVNATIYSATFGITAITSGGYCNTDATNNVDIYAPNPTGGNYVQSGKADYDYWSSRVGSVVTHANFDGSQTCSGSGTGSFNVTSAVSAEVGTRKTGNQTFVLAAEDTTDELGTKRFVFTKGTAGNPTLTVTYDKAPSKPTNPTLSVGDGCDSTIGDTGVNLIATTGDVMPFQLTNTFDLYLDGTSATNNLLTGTTATNNGVPGDTNVTTPGQPTVLQLPEKFLKALSPTSPITLDWTVTSSDATPLSSPPSTICKFTFDPSRPGPPTVTPDPNAGTAFCTVDGSTGGTPPNVGSSCTFDLTAPTLPSGQSVSGYTYELNQQAPVTVGNVGSITITVPQIVNTLTVNALSGGGNIGGSAVVDFDAGKLSPAAADGSVTNDGEPDMITAGGSGVLPSGLWLAQSTHDGALTAASNIGLTGLGYDVTSTDLAADWDGASVITGNFCGIGTQDVMAYYPTGEHAGGSTLACSNGAASQLSTVSASPLSKVTATQANSGGTFSNGTDNATQITDAYNTSGKNTGEPDLFATIDNQLFLFAATSPNSYQNDLGSCGQNCDILTKATPPTVNGTATNWGDWTVTTAQVGTSTDMYLWNPTDKVLDLWTGITADTTGGAAYPNFTGLKYTQYTGTVPWTSTQTGLILRAATLNPSATAPSLWMLDPTTGNVTTYNPTLSNTTLSLSTSTGATSTMTASSHSWQFTDMPEGDAGTALASTSDSATAGLTLTNSQNSSQNGSQNDVTWHAGDVYSPDALLNTAADGQTPLTARAGSLAASGPAVTVNSSFTVSAAVRPNAVGGTVLSQNGTTTAGFTLGSTTAGQWQFCMARSDVASPTLDCATAGTVNVGLWTSLTATYDSNMGIMRLYVNGTEAAVIPHAKANTFISAAFQVGDAMVSGAASSFYSGQVADIATWNAVLPPAQHVTAGSDFVPMVTPTRILDTRNGTGTGTAGPVTSDSTTTVTIAGNSLTSPAIPTTGITAAAVSITETGSSANGFLTAYPDGTSMPVSSTLNYFTTGNYTNNAIVPVGTDGKFDLYNNSTGTAQLIVDITGYYTTDTTVPNASTYVPLKDPTRVLDTRKGTGAPQAQVAANGTLTLAIAPNVTAGIPGNQAQAEVTGVAINLTAVNATGIGVLIGYPESANHPNTSSLNYNTVGAVASTVIIPVSPTDGKIDIYNSSSTPIDIIGDVSGYYTTSSTADGEHYYATSADRLLDTRTYNPLQPTSQPVPPLSSDATIDLPVPSNISAYNPTLVLNLTATQPAAIGALIVYPADQTRPNTSALNWSANQTVANLSVAASTSGGGVNLYNSSSGSVELIVDTDGYFD